MERLYTYTRHCFRKSDGKRFVETVTITGDDIAVHMHGRAGREAFLELLNRWNRNSTMNDEYFYCYVGE